MRKKRKTVDRVTAGFLGLAVLISIRIIGYCMPYESQELHFSVEDSFSDEDLMLELSTFLRSEIYYTLDGSEPNRDALLYEEPIHLEAGDTCRATPVRAIAYYRDGTDSGVYTKTYFCGKDVEQRFTTAIVSISGDPADLFDYEKGILVTGKLRDDYVMEHPDEEFTDEAPANYNLRGPESERKVTVEMWEPDGQPLLEAQQMGIRVHGGASRGSIVKSLRLIAREEYGSKRLNAHLFDDGEEEPDKRVLLRNHGNDQEKGFLRNELAERLARDAGFPCTQRFRPASVWINGEYYGFEWMEEVYDEQYLESLYGTREKKGHWEIAVPYKGEEEGETENADLTEVLNYAGKDLTEDAVFTELSQKLDVENFLEYCAIELYLANPDWPYNNCKAYRWYASDDTYEEEGGTDGRWRFLLYDLDMGMARIDEASYETHSLARALGIEESSWEQETRLFKALMQREDMQQRFTEILEDYMNGAFSSEHAEAVQQELETWMDAEMEVQMQDFAEKYGAKHGNAEEYYEVHKGKHEKHMLLIREFFQERPAVMRKELENLQEMVDNCEKQEYDRKGGVNEGSTYGVSRLEDEY